MTTLAPEIETVFEIEDLLSYDESDNDKAKHKTHIVNPPMNTHIWQPGMEMQEVVTIARMNGYEVTALCGYKWVPKRNPERFDMCMTCLARAEELMAGAGE